MNEGDRKVADWQTWEDWSPEPKTPDGMVPAGPWYPFAAIAAARGEEGTLCSLVIYRRPLVRAEEWVPLASLPPGSLFETKNGEQGVKLAIAATEPECVRVAWLDGGQLSTQTAGFLVRRAPLPEASR